MSSPEIEALKQACQEKNAEAVSELLAEDGRKAKEDRVFNAELLRALYTASSDYYFSDMTIPALIFAHVRAIDESKDFIDRYEHIRMVKHFLEVCQTSPVNLPKIKKLIDAGLDLNTPDDERMSPFARACQDPKIPGTVIKFLIDHGANPSPDVTGSFNSPLLVARRHKNFDAYKALVVHGLSDETLKAEYKDTYFQNTIEDKHFREILVKHAKSIGKPELLPTLNIGYLNELRRKEVFELDRHLPRGKLKQKLIKHIVRELEKNHSTLSTAQALTQPVVLKDEDVKFTRLERLLLGKKADQPWTLAAALNVHRHLLHPHLTQSYKHWLQESMKDPNTTPKEKVILFLQMTVDRMKSEPFHRQSAKESALVTLLEDLKADQSQMTLRDLCEFRGTGPAPLLRVLLTHRSGKKDEALKSGLELEPADFQKLDQPKSYQEFAEEFKLDTIFEPQQLCDILNAKEQPTFNPTQ